MKQFLFFIIMMIAYGNAFTQAVPEESPSIARTGYLTNLNGKMMQAYPNPAVSEVNIQHVATKERATISIISTDGKVLQQRLVLPNTFQTKLNVSTLNKGLYILRFDDLKGDVRTIQLVKN
jgi:Secretion system C-terminal sorting domain